MFRKLLIILMASLMIFVCTISVLRVVNGRSANFSLRSLGNVVSMYDSPHMTEFVLTTNFFTDITTDWRDGVTLFLTNPYFYFTHLRSLHSTRPRTFDSTIEQIQNGLDLTDILGVPMAIIYDMGYNVYFVLTAIDSLITSD